MTSIPKPKIDLSDVPWISCSENNRFFERGTMLKEVSAVMSTSGKKELIPVEIFVCTKCGKVPKFVYDRIPDINEEDKSTCTF